MLKLNFHHLFYFFQIAESGQFARAAKRLRIGQPTLSTQIRQFEDQLGYRLFDRARGRTLTLTPKGTILHRYAKEIFRLSDEMLAAARGTRTDRRYHLRVGALDSLPKREVSAVIESVVGRFDCFVSVHEDTSATLLKKLADHRFDLIITNSPVTHSETRPFIAHRIAHLPVVVYGAPRFSGLRKGFPASLAGQPFVFPTRHGKTRQAIDDCFSAEGIEVKALGEAQDGELLRRAALAGKALVPLSPSTVETEVERKELVAIGRLPQVHEDVWAIASRRLVDHPVVNQLMSEFAKAANRNAEMQTQDRSKAR
jgi:LysR family transcriptional activator of nhaA